MSQALDLKTQIAPVSYGLYTRDFDAFTQALGDSYARWGFAVISDHGLPQDRVDAALEQMKAFFALPEAV
ncbi:MAG TPA: 2-oxoglutarate and iron-dependent oxygenase domain-containing protein, partial [Phenylobacterium sp.]